MRDWLDTRAWNLVAGLALTGGCGPRVASDGESGSESSSAATQTGSESETTAAECVTNDDCPPSHFCDAGICHYYAVPDGADMERWYPECFIDEDCLALELCFDSSCVGVGTPPPCGVAFDEQPSVLDIPAAALALSFVDVDDDGAAELVVATSTALHVFESSGGPPQTSGNAMAWAAPIALAGAQLDGMPGADVIVASTSELAVHGSDGLGGFGPAQLIPSPFGSLAGVATGDIDSLGTADVLTWGQAGAGVLNGLVLGNVATEHASLRDLSASVSGFTLLRGATLSVFELDGTPLGEAIDLGGSPRSLISVGGAFDLSSAYLAGGGWSVIQVWNPEVVTPLTGWGVLGTVTSMGSGSLTDDGLSDLALLIDGGLWLHLDALEPGSCLVQVATPTPAVEIALGDHDGDGDDELAVRLDDGAVLVFDGEG